MARCGKGEDPENNKATTSKEKRHVERTRAEKEAMQFASSYRYHLAPLMMWIRKETRMAYETEHQSTKDRYGGEVCDMDVRLFWRSLQNTITVDG